MAILTLLKGVGGTVETYFLDGPPSTCSVTVRNDYGTVKVDGASCSIDTVSTTIAAASAKATTLILASAAGVVNGRRYLIGSTASTQPLEVVTVKSLSGSTATLYGPLLNGYVASTTFRGIRASYAVTSTEADALWFGGHADFVPNTGDAISEDVDCTQHKIPEALFDETDLRDVFPKLGKMIDAETDLPRTIRNARDNFLVDFGGKFRVMAALGATAFRRVAAKRWWLDRRWALGPDWADDMDRLEKDYFRDIAKLQAQVPVDKDGDESTNGVDDTAFNVIHLDRA